MISSGQIKAARAILGWSQEKLALMSGLTKNTICNLESNTMSPRPASERTIRAACEKAGLEFIEPDGVKRIPLADTIRIMRGQHACEEFFQDIYWTISEKGGDIIALSLSQRLIEDICSVTQDNIERLNRIAGVTTVKCILGESLSGEGHLPPFKFRLATRYDIGPASYFVYGNKHAVVQDDGGGHFKFLIYTSTMLSEAYRSHFHTMWDIAVPMLHTVGSGNLRTRK